MTDGPYTTITVTEYTYMKTVMDNLRRRIQKARECLEKGAAGEALQVLKFEGDSID